jgi:3-deoxy-D-manno-octulosonate 8-phosphate phosphatase (KDO 8-P phosphatase)
MNAELIARARRVRLLTCDVDGVLTDGRIYVDDHGHEFKAFSALDGVGTNLLARAGIVVAWITGSAAAAVTHRAQQLQIPHVVLDAHDKMTPWQRLRMELGLAPDECAHIGDDLPDIPLLALCGLAVTVPHAPAAVRAHAHYVTSREGGSGAVRELADMILAAQGHGDGLAARRSQLPVRGTEPVPGGAETR